MEQPHLFDTVFEYKVPKGAREECENELRQWITDGWLVPYKKDVYGQVRGTIPLMAVGQQSKQRLRPVHDFRELISYLNLHTATQAMRTFVRRKYEIGDGFARRSLTLTYVRRTYKSMFTRRYGRTKL